MLRLIAYDITEPKRLRKVARLCLDYGIRIEYSMFECNLEEEVFEKFWHRLLKIVNPEKDRCAAFRICADCAKQIRSVGLPPHLDKQNLFIL